MENREIEKKWIVKDFPEDSFELIRTYEAEQAYICSEDKRELRIRKIYHRDFDEYLMTYKEGNGLSRKESEVNIYKDMYDFFLELILKNGHYPIRKICKEYLYKGKTLVVSEVDTKTNHSFTYAEIEFSSEEEANNFKMDIPFSFDVTGEKYHQMKNYWNRTRLNDMSSVPSLELDLDGVIFDCYHGINRIVKEKHNIDFDIKNVNDYEFSCCSEEVKNTIFSCFDDFQYMTNLPMLGFAKIALEEILDLVKAGKLKLRINSLVYNDKIKNHRLKYLNKNIKKDLDIEVNLPVGTKKPMLKNCDYTIEDSVKNLQNSQSKQKFLIANNINENHEEIENLTKRCSLLTAINDIKMDLVIRGIL